MLFSFVYLTFMSVSSADRKIVDLLQHQKQRITIRHMKATTFIICSEPSAVCALRHGGMKNYTDKNKP